MKASQVFCALTLVLIAVACKLIADEPGQNRGVNHVFITGTSSCSLCDSVGDKHDIMLTTNGGIRFVLKGDSDQYKAVHKVRKEGKTITVRLVGKMTEKIGSDKKPYLECKVRDIVVKDV